MPAGVFELLFLQFFYFRKVVEEVCTLLHTINVPWWTEENVVVVVAPPKVYAWDSWNRQILWGSCVCMIIRVSVARVIRRHITSTDMRSDRWLPPSYGSWNCGPMLQVSGHQQHFKAVIDTKCLQKLQLYWVFHSFLVLKTISSLMYRIWPLLCIWAIVIIWFIYPWLYITTLLLISSCPKAKIWMHACFFPFLQRLDPVSLFIPLPRRKII